MPFLRILNGPKRWTRVRIPDEGLVIGRGEDVHLRLEDAWISREHLVVEPQDEGGWRVRDLGSENGSVLNDAAVTESPIAHGDRLRIGATEMRFFHQEAAPAEEPETLVERLQRRIEDLEDENRRLRRLAAESGVRQARPRGARRTPRFATDAETRSFRAVTERPRHISLGRRGLRLLRSLRDFGVEDVSACDLPPPGPRAPKDGRTPGERLIQWLDGQRADGGWLLTSSRALEIWVPDPESETSIAEPGVRGPVLVLVRDEGAVGATLPWLDWAARAGFGPFFVGTPVTEPREGEQPGDGELALASLLVELEIEAGSESPLLDPEPESIHVLGGAARSEMADPEGLYAEAAGPGRIQRGLGDVALPVTALLVGLGRELSPERAEELESALRQGLFSEKPDALRIRVDEGKGVRMAGLFRHPFEARP